MGPMLMLIYFCFGFANSLKLQIEIKQVDEAGNSSNNAHSQSRLSAKGEKSECPKQNICGSHLRIIDGCAVEPHSLPWQVGIVRSANKSDNHCGGSLICPKFVLSAAHCLEEVQCKQNFTEDEFLVTVGKHKLSNHDEGTYHQIEKFYMHPDFDCRTYNNDLSVILLKKPVAFSPKVQAISIPALLNMADQNAELPPPYAEDEKFVVSGWGARKSEQGDFFDVQSSCYADELNAVTVPMVNRDQCNETHTGRITKNMICAGGSGSKDSCQADSGGPLIRLTNRTYLELVGVVSWGAEECGTVGTPGVYALVSEGIEWLKRIVGDCNNVACQGNHCLPVKSLDSSVKYLFEL